MEKLKIGVFGGGRGKKMINVLLGHPEAELVAVCDYYQPLLDKVRAMAEEHGANVALYADFDKFIEHDMDAVVLANYANEHATYAIRCLERGMHVLSEVLPCETMAQAVALIEAVEKSGKVYAYAENYCFMYHTFEMKRLYELGEIGEVEYGEGEYIHDCSDQWPSLTRGERSHWRNLIPPTFYCTHSIGPLLYITGQRPVSVVGFELPVTQRNIDLGKSNGAGIEMVTVENGAVFKSVHGWFRRAHGCGYVLYGEKGEMETGRLSENKMLNVWREGERFCHGAWEKYDPEHQIHAELADTIDGHKGGDFYPTHFFIEKILGREDGKYCMDVYEAVDMGICGILAYRSILNGNTPVMIPNLRNPEEREAYRNDNACTNPAVCGEDALPSTSHGTPPIPDETYERVRALFKEGRPGSDIYKK